MSHNIYADVDLMDGIIDIPNVRLQTFDGKVNWWNGFAPPMFTRDQIDLMIEQLDRWHAENADSEIREGPFEVQRQGEVVVVLEEYTSEDEMDVKVYEPDADGLYAVGCWEWAWSAANLREE